MVVYLSQFDTQLLSLGGFLNRYEPVPEQPDQTNFFWHHYVADPKKYESRETVWLNNQVDDEDVVAMDFVSKGIKSGLGVRGRFAPEEEKGPHWFHREVYRQIFEYQALNNRTGQGYLETARLNTSKR